MPFTLKDLYKSDPNSKNREKRFGYGTVVGISGGIMEIDVGASLPDGTPQNLFVPTANGFDPSAGDMVALQYSNDSVHSGYAGAVGSSSSGGTPSSASHGILDHTDSATYIDEPLLTTSTVTHNILIATTQVLVGATSDLADAYGPHKLYLKTADSKNVMAMSNATGSIVGSFYVGSDASFNAFQFGTVSNDNFGFFTNNGLPQFSMNTNGGAVIGANANSHTPPANGLEVSGAVISDTSLTTPNIYGSSAANGSVVIQGTSNATESTSSTILQPDGGYVGIGTSSPAGAFHLMVDNAPASTYNASFLEAYGSTASWAVTLNFRRGRGNAASPSAVTSGDRLGGMLFNGYNGASYTASTGIISTTTEAFSATARGANITFETTPNGSISRLVALTIGHNGNITFGGLSTSTYKLHGKSISFNSSPVFTGAGLNDATGTQAYTGTDTSAQTYTVIIDGTGAPDTFKWQKGAGAFTAGVAITGSNQTLTDGVIIKFAATTGHTLNDQWVITANVSNPLGLLNAAGTVVYAVLNDGRSGLSVTPSAWLTLPAGLATAGFAPIKFTSGTPNTTAVAGCMEFTTDTLTFVITTGAARKGVVLDDGSRLTSGKIPIATTNGRLIDGQTPLSGTKVYYVSDSNGGAVNRKLTFTNGILTAET